MSRALRAACPICLLVFALISSLISATLVCLPSVPPSVRLSILLSSRLFSLFAVRLSKHNLSLIILCVRTYTGCLQGFHSKLNIIVMTVPHTVATHTHTHANANLITYVFSCHICILLYVCTCSHKLSVMQMHFLLVHEKVEQSVSV